MVGLLEILVMVFGRGPVQATPFASIGHIGANAVSVIDKAMAMRDPAHVVVATISVEDFPSILVFIRHEWFVNVVSDLVSMADVVTRSIIAQFLG
jgi:hypothetical protein